ncbi:MAG: DUF5777 family beta-barrel protein [Myxococcota bacterium]
MLSSASGPSAEEAQVKKIFAEWCNTCHYGGTNPPSDPSELNLEVEPRSLIGINSVVNGKPLIVPGDPKASYLYAKMKSEKGIDGELMPLGDEMPAKDLKLVGKWIANLPPNAGKGKGGGGGGGAATKGTDEAPTAKADPAKEARVKEIFDDKCTACHSGSGNENVTDPAEIDLEVAPNSLLAVKSVVNGKPMVVPGKPDESYLLLKMVGGDGMDGELMPLGDEMTPDEITAIRDWIADLPPPSAGGGGGGGGVDVGGDGAIGGDDQVGGGGSGGGGAPKKKGPKPFHGTTQIALPTTTTLGKRKLQYRIDHRFGAIGTERGAFGLDGGVSMSMGLTYGIFDGWDVQLRRANSRKTWELGTKYVPIRQEDGQALSFGGYAAISHLRDFDVANPWVGDFQLMLSRLWFERWSTMLVLGYHINTNHNSRVTVDFDDGQGPVVVNDTRDTLTMGIATTVWLGKKKKWGIDAEYVLPIPDGGTPNTFYYRGGDADPDGSAAGAWSLGGSLRTAKHFFQVFFTNNREIATNLYAAGGQTGNPFNNGDDGARTPLHRFNFFLGFNLGRQFSIKKPKSKEERAKKKEERAKKKQERAEQNGSASENN